MDAAVESVNKVNVCLQVSGRFELTYPAKAVFVSASLITRLGLQIFNCGILVALNGSQHWNAPVKGMINTASGNIKCYMIQDKKKQMGNYHSSERVSFFTQFCNQQTSIAF